MRESGEEEADSDVVCYELFAPGCYVQCTAILSLPPAWPVPCVGTLVGYARSEEAFHWLKVIKTSQSTQIKS